MDVGTTIKGIRKQMGQKQLTFAAGIGMTQTSLSHMEKNKTAPHASTLEKIAEYSKVPIPLILLMSIEESDAPKDAQKRFKKQWPFIMDAAINMFQIPK